MRAFTRGVLLSGVGACLVLFSTLASYHLSYKYGPSRSMYDWRPGHSKSDEQMVALVVRSIRRGVWPHEAGSILGDGNEETMAFIIRHLPSDVPLTGCEYGHIHDGLTHLCNQNPGTFATNWNEWWTTNSQLTQTRWITDGFAMSGISVSTSAVLTDISKLLITIGQTNAVGDGAYSAHIRYNAHRWLRDLNFRSSEFLLTNGSMSISRDTLLGLQKFETYQNWRASPRYPNDRIWGRRPPYAAGKVSMSLLQRVFAAKVPDMLLPVLAVAGLMLIRVGIRIGRTMPSSVPLTRGTPPAGQEPRHGSRSAHG